MKRNRGFTVIELLVVVAILSILMGVAAPSLRDLLMNATVTSQANDLMSAFATARSEAIRRGVRTAICTSTNGTSCTNSNWHEGWIVFTDADANGAVDAGSPPLKVQPTTDGQNTLTSAGHGTNGAGSRFVAFSPVGSLAGGLATVTGVGSEWSYPAAAWLSWLVPLALFELTEGFRRRANRVSRFSTSTNDLSLYSSPLTTSSSPPAIEIIARR